MRTIVAVAVATLLLSCARGEGGETGALGGEAATGVWRDETTDILPRANATLEWRAEAKDALHDEAKGAWGGEVKQMLSAPTAQETRTPRIVISNDTRDKTTNVWRGVTTHMWRVAQTTNDTPRVKSTSSPARIESVRAASLDMDASVSASSPLSSSRSLARFNFLVGVAQVGALHENDTSCGRELDTLLKAVERKEFWSLKVLDSFGAPPKTFSWGNYHWFASQRQCKDLNAPYVVPISERLLHTYKFNIFNVTSPFRMRFTMIYMRFKTPHFIDVRLPYESVIHIGLCLPQSCSVAALQRYTDEYFQRGDFVTQREFELQLKSVSARSPSFGGEAATGVWRDETTDILPRANATLEWRAEAKDALHDEAKGAWGGEVKQMLSAPTAQETRTPRIVISNDTRDKTTNVWRGVTTHMWRVAQTTNDTPRVKSTSSPARIESVRAASLDMDASVSASSPLSSSRSLARFNFLVGVAQVGALHENDTSCGRELDTLLKAVERKEFWSLKVLDSFGAPPKTFSWGNYHWFASQRQCKDLNAPYVVPISERLLHTYKFNIFNVTSPFRMRFTMIYMRFKTPHFIDVRLPYESVIHIGLCLPQSCSVAALQRYTDEYFQRGDFVTQREFELQLKSVSARSPSFGLVFFQQTGTIISIAILTTFLILIGFAELVHRSKEKLKLQQLLHTKAPIVVTTIDGVHIANVSMSVDANEKAAKSSTLEELLLCFRWTDNWRRALQPERVNSNSNFLGAIAGVRTIICLWVSTFHVYYYSVFALSNAPMMFAVLGNFLNQPLLQAVFFVDIFFVMSALLLVYNFLSTESRLKEIRQNSFLQNMKLFLKLLLHRYLRLTPMVFVTMALTDVGYDLINTFSPFYLGVNSGYYCKQRWWHNLLYIQNFLDMKDICCSWTWYLACEMQFYILVTAVLFLYAKSERWAKIVFIALVVGFAAFSCLCNYNNGITFDIDVLHSTLNQLYVKPWVRINPYLGGALCGWLLYHHGQQRQQRYHNHQQQQQKQQQSQRQQQQQQSQQQQSDELGSSPPTTSATIDSLLLTRSHSKIGYWDAAFWLFIALIYVVANFMSYWRNTPTWLVAIIMSFGKLLFALTIGGGILMCAWGNGGRLNTLLSAYPFRLLNKFCFSMYLLTPIITMIVYGLRNEPTNFNEIASGTDFIAVNVLAVLCSLLCYVIVELPMLRVCNRLLFKRKYA